MNTNTLVLDYNHINHSKLSQASDWIMAQGKDIDCNETVLMSVPLHDRTLDAHNFPEWLKGIMSLAWDNNAYYIIFQTDGEVVNSLMYYLD